MESLLDFLVPLIRLLSTIVVVGLFFLFMVRPLLNYFFVNYEIEHRKRQAAAMMEAELANDSEESPPDGAELSTEETDSLQNPRASVKGEIERLAASDPERAGELVKQWIKQ